MGRKKIDDALKNKIICVSVLASQKEWIENHPNFDISKFIQISLADIINTYESFPTINNKEVKNDRKKTA